MKTYALHLLSILFIGFGLPDTLLASPPNDSFAVPTVVAGFPASAAGSNINATLQSNEPLPDAAGSTTQPFGSASVWFEWTAPITGAVQIDTLGSDFDTILGVWTGLNLASLSEVASNDEYGGTQSAVFIDVVMGVTYRIAVYGYSEDQGEITLHITNDTTSRISGTVTGSDGISPLSGISVIAYSQGAEGQFAEWEPLAFATTQTNGTYTIRGLTSNAYRVEFGYDEDGNYVHEFYEDAIDVESAEDINVAATTTVTEINASLVLTSKISGIVTGPNGTVPLSGIDVSAYRLNDSLEYWEWVSSATTQSDGSYVVDGLTTGTYRVGFTDDDQGDYITEYFNNAVRIESATDISVPTATTISEINASLVVPAPPEIKGLRKLSPTSFELSFTATPGKPGQLQESMNLVSWSNVGGMFTCQHGVNTRSITSSESKVFWRVKIEP